MSQAAGLGECAADAQTVVSRRYGERAVSWPLCVECSLEWSLDRLEELYGRA